MREIKRLLSWKYKVREKKNNKSLKNWEVHLSTLIYNKRNEKENEQINR